MVMRELVDHYLLNLSKKLDRKMLEEEEVN